MHFRSAGTLVRNAMETTQKNEVIVYLLCSTNYEINNIKILRFSFVHKIDTIRTKPIMEYQIELSISVITKLMSMNNF
jgi:hypothetical protein